jgi:hypothetical protein
MRNEGGKPENLRVSNLFTTRNIILTKFHFHDTNSDDLNLFEGVCPETNSVK